MDFIRFEKSKNKRKKYDALIKNKETGNINRVGFGSRIPLMQQYKDTTGLGLYSSLDHLDKKRRDNFRKRHSCDTAKKMTGRYWSCSFLW
jgi:outer membrane scaffolding protein for murein synthesis (MipA/OmpV family)